MNNNVKSRKFNLLLYPEDETHKNALDIITQKYKYAYILHDKDTDENGEVIKEHYHVVISFTNARYKNAVASELGIEPNYLEVTNSVDSSLMYLIHYENEEKYQYRVEDVHGSMKSRLVKLLNSNDKDEEAIMLDVLNYIDEQGIITTNNFMRWACASGYYGYCRRSQYWLNLAIKEHNDFIRIHRYEA